MVYRKKFKKKYKKKTLAAAAYALAKKNKREMKTELKYNQPPVSETPDNTGFDLVLLNGVDVGDTAQTRDGNKIYIKNIQFRLTLIKASAATETSVRVMLIQDKQPNGAAFSITDVLVTDSISQVRNLKKSNRFKVFYDKIHIVHTYRPMTFIKYFKRCNIQTQYIDTGNGVADITSNSLYLAFISDESVNAPSIAGYARLRFTD